MHNPAYMYNTDKNFALSCARLAEGTNANTIKTQSDLDYSINSLLYYKATTDNIAMTALAEQPEKTDCLYLVSINAAGTVSIKKGTPVTNGSGEPIEWPTPPSGLCTFGAFKVTTAASTTFTCGTTDLSAAGISVAFYNFSCVPPYHLTA